MKASVQTIEVRESILDATDHLLSRYGYRKMTIDDLAAEVGIGKGSVYLHFSSKDEIVLSHIDRIVDRITQRLSEIAKSGLSSTEKIRQMVLTRVMLRFDSVQHYSTSLDELLAALRPKLLLRRAGYFRAESKILSQVLKEGIEQGDFGNGNPSEIADAILVCTNSLLPYSLSAHELGERSELESRVEKIVSLLLNGIIIRK